MKGAPVETWEPAPDHFSLVADLAEARASKFGCASLGSASGLTHDVGKLDPRFTPRFFGPAPAFDHAAAGAAYMSGAVHPPMLGKLLAYGIAGHHTGLANGASSNLKTRRQPLQTRVAAALPALPAVIGNARACGIELPTRLEMPEGFSLGAPGTQGFTLSFLARMLFSCLVDADYLGTERFYAGVENRTIGRGGYPALRRLRDALTEHLKTLEAKARPTKVNLARSEILKACGAMADRGVRGTYSLTVPTGGGKTMTSSAFALRHAVAADLDRVIVVVPFTSVIEQTASDLRAALGPEFRHAVVEHHSATDDTGEMPEGIEKARLAVENWDAPIIVTTTVQFFESLFSSKPGRCRKLHNISRSVVVLDEAQALPLHLLRPIVAVLGELVRNYRATLVLATATQPALLDRPEEGFAGLCGVRELCPDVKRIFETFRRVQVRHAGRLDDGAVESFLRSNERILAIVNTKRHARELFDRVSDLPHAYHLSTSMTGSHRSAVLAEIKSRLRDGLPCVVVSTQLIEAGVNVDFPVVMRADTGIDGIAQAAGRCNREGMLEGLGEVIVFSVDARHALRDVEPQVDIARGILRRLVDGSMPGTALDPSTVDAYFRDLYWSRGADGLDSGGIMSMLETGVRDANFPFETVDDLFEMIDEGGTPVIVQAHGAAEAFGSLPHGAGALEVSRATRRHTVNVRDGRYQGLVADRHIEFFREPEFGSQFPFLTEASALYDPRTGLAL